MIRLAMYTAILIAFSGCVSFTDGFVSSGSFVWSEDATVQITVDAEAGTLTSGDTTYELELLPKGEWLIGCPTMFTSVRTEAWALAPGTFEVGEGELSITDATISAECGGWPIMYSAALASDGFLDGDESVMYFLPSE